MADPKSAQDKFTYGRWQAGRLEFPGRGGDRDDVWVVDVIVVEEAEDEDVRALGRYRPARGMTPDLGPVIDRAIREPVDGRPHLPAIVRVASAELAAEIHKRRPEVKVVIGPTPLIDELGTEVAEDILPDPDDGEERWRWLEEGVKPEQIKRLFDAMSKASQTLMADVLGNGQLMRVTVPTLGLQPAWVHVTSEAAITGGSVVSVAIAPDDKTREAWVDDESTDSEIAIYGIEQDELPPEAHAELMANGWSTGVGFIPRVTAGGDDERYPTAKEIEIAIAVLECIAGFFDPFAADISFDKPRTVALSSGAQATIVTRADEILELDDDDDEGDDDDFITPGSAAEEDEHFLDLDFAKTWTAAPAPANATFIRAQPKPGRNDPCWCGSGLKYKKCHVDKDP